MRSSIRTVAAKAANDRGIGFDRNSFRVDSTARCAGAGDRLRSAAATATGSLLRAGVGQWAADHHDVPASRRPDVPQRATGQAAAVLCARPQTGIAQGPTPGFFHDHVIATAPRQRGFTPFMHGYVVICSPQGISTGACTFNIETLPGSTAPLPLTKSVTGYDLTFAADIQAAADAGLVVLIDTGAVFLGTVGPSS